MGEKPPDWLTPDEAADLLRVNRETIYNQIRRGALPATRMGRVYRIPRAAVKPADPGRLAEPRATYAETPRIAR